MKRIYELLKAWIESEETSERNSEDERLPQKNARSS